MAAHSLASLALVYVDQCWIEDVPSQLNHVISADVNSCAGASD